MEQIKKYILIVGGVIIAAIIIAALLYQNLALFGAKPRRVPSPAGAEVSPSVESKTLNGEKPYTVEIVPFEKLPPYSGVPVVFINESEASKKITPASVREKLTAQLATVATTLAENPDDLDGWIEAGSVKHTLGDEIGARDAWEYAGIIRPKNITSFFNLGNLYGYYLKDKIKAEKNYKIVLQNDPNYVFGYLALAAFYREVYRDKYPAEAEKALLAGEKNLPLDLNIFKTLAFLYKNTGNAEKAAAYFEKYLAIEPGNNAIRGELEALRQ